MTGSRLIPPPLSSWLACSYFDEPLLHFGNDGLHIDPKAGIARYGPYTFGPGGRHPDRVRVGLIGGAEPVTDAREWLERWALGVRGDDTNPEFPGWMPDRGFCSALEFSQDWIETLTQTEQRDLLAIRKQRDRFEAAVGLVDGKLRLLAERDNPPDYIVIVVSDELYRRCSVADYRDGDQGMVHRDLRRAVKAAAMRYRIPTQLVREQTVQGRDPTPASKIAWNFFTGMYCKAGGIPWAPYGLAPGTCYLGIGFFHPLGSPGRVQTSLVQAFDQHGDGLVLRGHDFEWDPAETGTKAPHLPAEQAAHLVELALTRYEQELKQPPVRVVVHKTSRYWPEELDGFRLALERRVRQFDLMALESQSHVRLITTAKYPPLRGTRFTLGELDFLYTTGFVSALGEFHGMHVPSPLQVADHIGHDTARETLLREVLALTKLNWNSAQLGGSLPITIRFARLVGDVLREVPANREPLPQFKFYI